MSLVGVQLSIMGVCLARVVLYPQVHVQISCTYNPMTFLVLLISVEHVDCEAESDTQGSRYNHKILHV